MESGKYGQQGNVEKMYWKIAKDMDCTWSYKLEDLQDFCFLAIFG